MARVGQQAATGDVTVVDAQHAGAGARGGGGSGEAVTLDLEGDPVPAFRGETVAVALFASGARALSRSLKYHRPRSFFCLAGHCGACLMRIDGRPNVKACQTPCSDGLRVASQNAWPSAEHDAFGVVDWLFPRGMDHHHMFTGSRAMNAVLRKVTRQMSGLGRLPDPLPGKVRPETPPLRRLAGDSAPDVLVVGAGPAGLAACQQPAARAGLAPRGGRAGLARGTQDIAGDIPGQAQRGLEAPIDHPPPGF